MLINGIKAILYYLFMENKYNRGKPTQLNQMDTVLCKVETDS